MKRSVTRVVFCVASLVAVVSRGELPAEHVDAPFEGFDNFVEKSLSDVGVPGLAVAVVRGDDIVYVKGFGLRDVENTLPVTPHTLFPICSCGKAFTALAAGILVDEGKLDWNTPVAEYLSDFRLYDDYATLHATPRDLLCHRTGVPAYDMLWLTVPLSRDEYYRRLRYLQPSVGFREEFQYNSLMYIAAGVLVGRLSGGTWEEFIAQRIFEPLGMSDSNFSVVESQRTDDFSLPYFSFGRRQVEIPFRNVDAIGPAGSINSSASDMAKWLLLQVGRGIVAGRRIVSEDSLNETHRPHVVVSDSVTTRVYQASLYGQGWFISRYRDHNLVEHPGGIDGFFALVSLLPDDDIGVVILTNTLPNMLTYLVSRNIFDRMLGLDIIDRDEQYTELLTSMKQAWGPPAESAKPQPNTRPSLPLDAYTGTYEHPAFGPVRITLEKDQLSADHLGSSHKLKHFHYDVFKGRGSALAGKKLTGQSSALAGRRLQFHLDPVGNVESFSMGVEPTVEAIFFPRIRGATARGGLAREPAMVPQGVDSLEEITLGGAKQVSVRPRPHRRSIFAGTRIVRGYASAGT